MTTISLKELGKFFDRDTVKNRKIDCVNTLRTITGEGILEAKAFLEQVIQPAILQAGETTSSIGESKGLSVPSSNSDGDPNPPMFLIGHSYRQFDKNIILIVGAANQNNSHETVYSIDSNGQTVHRYNRRDFGRVTGTDPNHPDPRNLERI